MGGRRTLKGNGIERLHMSGGCVGIIYDEEEFSLAHAGRCRLLFPLSPAPHLTQLLSSSSAPPLCSCVDNYPRYLDVPSSKNLEPLPKSLHINSTSKLWLLRESTRNLLTSGETPPRLAVLDLSEMTCFTGKRQSWVRPTVHILPGCSS